MAYDVTIQTFGYSDAEVAGRVSAISAIPGATVRTARVVGAEGGIEVSGAYDDEGRDEFCEAVSAAVARIQAEG